MQLTLPLVVILMGPPGAGKGTHACPLSHHLGVPHISTGDLFREEIRTRSPFGIRAKAYMDQGNLVPDELVFDILFHRVSQPDCKQGYILDGFPRTMAQAVSLDQRLKSTNTVIVLNFNLPDATIIERVTGRMSCNGCGRPYHKIFDPPRKELTCDCCESALCCRVDDGEEIVRKRLEVYRAQTEPLIAYYRKQNDVLREIDSRKEKSAVFHDVLDSLPQTLSLRS